MGAVDATLNQGDGADPKELHHNKPHASTHERSDVGSHVKPNPSDLLSIFNLRNGALTKLH